jgi:hypothetical protein
VRERGGGFRPYWLIAWPLLFGLWLLLAGTVAVPELVAGAVAATLALAGGEVIRRLGLVRFGARLSWLPRALRLPGRTVADFGLLLAALWRRAVLRRPVRGRFRAVPFRWGGTDPRSVGRRALATLVLSAPPNSYVVDCVRAENRIVIHELVSTDAPSTEILGP